MGEKSQKFKKETIGLLREVLAELPLAFFLGTLPILLFSRNPKKLDEMVSGLLAIGPLIYYYAWMLLPYFIVLGVKYAFRFRTERGNATFNFTHKTITEVGTGFQTILRTGGGVAIGILALPTKITSATTAHYWMLLWMVAIFLTASSAISIFRKKALELTEHQPYKNPLKLDIKQTKN